MSKYVEGVEFVTEECCDCGIPFAMTADFQRRRRNDHKDFYCPSGHAQHYIGQTEAQKLRRELDRTRSNLDAERGRAAALEEQRNAIKRAHNRMRDRVKNGACPCCNRTFQNLLEHMKGEHPDFGSHQALRALRDTFGLTQSALAEEIGIGQPGYISNFERERPVPEYAASMIESWIEANS